MKRFERYCTDIREIDGIKTYIVSQKYLNDILSDLELLALVGQSMPLMEIRKIMQYLVDEAKSNPIKIFLAFAEHSNTQKTLVWWEPINCYKDGDFYYHVHIRGSWMCRECRQMNYQKFIMPMLEHDATFYSGTDDKFPSISPLFKRKKCIYCEKILQNHFI